MRQSFNNLITILKDKVEGLKDGDGNEYFNTVSGYPRSNFDGYPSVYIRENNGEGEVIDTHRNERSWVYELRIFQEVGEKTKNPEQAAEIIRKAADKIMEAFDTDKDLGGKVEKVEIISVDFDFSDEASNFNIATFTIVVIDLVKNYN